MAYIEKRQYQDGVTYRARIRIQGMPEECASFPLRSLAKEWAQRKEAEMRAARYFPREEGKKRTFGSFVDLYTEKYLKKNQKSFSKQQQLMTYWKSKLGSYYLAHISPSMIAELRDELLSETTRRKTIRSTSTVNRYIASLSKAFTICVKELGWLKENPVLLITRPKEGKGRERYLSKDEIERLLTECKKSKSQHLYPIVLFALSTGARYGEILNLQWEDIDIVYNIAIFRDTKNGESRSVALTPQLVRSLKEERRKRFVLSPFVFPNSDGSEHADISQAWKGALKRTRLKNVRFHDLRHTAASYLAMSGASTLEIAAILGHKTLAMVKRYSHFSTSATATALNRMNDVIFGT